MAPHAIVNGQLPRGLRWLTRTVRVLALLGALALLSVPALFWSDAQWVALAGRGIVGLAPDARIVVDERARWIGMALTVPGLLLALWALLALWRLFGAYARGHFFDRDAQCNLRRFAWGLLLSAVCLPIQRAAAGVALTWGNPPGERMLVLGLGWHDYLGVLVGAVLLAIAWVQTVAAQLAEENAGFV